MAWEEICVTVLILGAVMLAMPASASSSSFSDLNTQIYSFDDSRINAQELAFYLASHGFDAQPKGGYVEVDLGGKICKLTPNGSAPGLADIAA